MEAHLFHLRQEFLQHDALSGAQVKHLGEQDGLRRQVARVNLPDVAVKQDTYVSPVLVNDHQTRLGGRQDVAAFQLKIHRLHFSKRQDRLFYTAVSGLAIGWRQVSILLAHAFALFLLKIGKQLVPVTHRLA